MKERFSHEEMEVLANYSDGLCVSLYMPTFRAGRETEQNSIQLKNLLPEAEKQLIEGGMRTKDARDLLAPGVGLLSDQEFWQHQSEGLALFFTEDTLYRYRVPVQFEMQTIVGPHFHLKPLMSLLHGNGMFYILALAQGENQLYQATRYDIEQLDADEIPASLSDALWYYEEQQTVQHHVASSPGLQGAEKAGLFHGQGESDPRQDKSYILEYFRHIDKGLTEMITGEQQPLVLAGVDYLLPIYREANTYKNLVPAGITGSPKMWSADKLHQQAWQIVETIFDEPRRGALARYNDLQGTEQASSRIEDVIPAAYYGRVDSLFVAADRYRWGCFDPDTKTLAFSEQSAADNEDLLDRAAVQTFLNGGAVYVMDSSQISDSGDIAAIYRY